MKVIQHDDFWIFPSGSFGSFWSVAGESQCCGDGVVGGRGGVVGGEQRGQLSYNSLSSNFLQNPASQTGQQSSSDFEAKGPEVYI